MDGFAHMIFRSGGYNCQLQDRMPLFDVGKEKGSNRWLEQTRRATNNRVL